MGLRRLNSAVKMFTVMLMGRGTVKQMRKSIKKLPSMSLRSRLKNIKERRKGDRRKK